MDNNDLLIVLIAFILGYFAYQMIGNMCRCRLVEGSDFWRPLRPLTGLVHEFHREWAGAATGKDIDATGGF